MKLIKCGIDRIRGGNNVKANKRCKMRTVWCTLKTKPQLEDGGRD